MYGGGGWLVLQVSDCKAPETRLCCLAVSPEPKRNEKSETELNSSPLCCLQCWPVAWTSPPQPSSRSVSSSHSVFPSPSTCYFIQTAFPHLLPSPLRLSSQPSLCSTMCEKKRCSHVGFRPREASCPLKYKNYPTDKTRPTQRRPRNTLK